MSAITSSLQDMEDSEMPKENAKLKKRNGYTNGKYFYQGTVSMARISAQIR